MMVRIDLDVLKILRDSLRTAGKNRILTESEYDALLHANAKLSEHFTGIEVTDDYFIDGPGFNSGE